jgi:hypothetical protein
MSNVKITLVAGIALILVVGAVVLTRSPPRVVRVGAPGGIVGNGILHITTSSAAVCQPNEVLPSGVSSIRLAVWGFFGAPVHLVAYSGSRVLTEGTRGADWTSDSVTVPVKPVSRTTSNVRLCFTLAPNTEPLFVIGAPAPAQEPAVALTSPRLTPVVAASDEQSLGGRMGIEYLSGGQGSWWSRVLSVARHMGFGRAFSGTWIALLTAALMAAVGVLAVRLALRELP